MQQIATTLLSNWDFASFFDVLRRERNLLVAGNAIVKTQALFNWVDLECWLVFR